MTLIIGNLNHPNMDSFKKDMVILSLLLSTKIPTFWNIIEQCTQIWVHKLLCRCTYSWWNNNSFLSRTTSQHCLLPLETHKDNPIKTKVQQVKSLGWAWAPWYKAHWVSLVLLLGLEGSNLWNSLGGLSTIHINWDFIQQILPQFCHVFIHQHLSNYQRYSILFFNLPIIFGSYFLREPSLLVPTFYLFKRTSGFCSRI